MIQETVGESLSDDSDTFQYTVTPELFKNQLGFNDAALLLHVRQDTSEEFIILTFTAIVDTSTVASTVLIFFKVIRPSFRCLHRQVCYGLAAKFSGDSATI